MTPVAFRRANASHSVEVSVYVGKLPQAYTCRSQGIGVGRQGIGEIEESSD